MLSVFTRHYPPCLRKDVHYRRCHCPKWIQGTLEHKSYFRQSAKTRTWKRAEIRARAMELADLRPKPILLKFAIEAFLADQKARKLLPTTIKKSQFLLETTFGGWCVQEGLDSLDQIGPANLTRFRSIWGDQCQSAHRKHERLRSFSLFASGMGGYKRIRWMD